MSILGTEVYENLDVQKRVNEAFKAFHHYENWVVISSPPSESSLTPEQKIDAVSEKIYHHLGRFLSAAGTEGITPLPLKCIE